MSAPGPADLDAHARRVAEVGDTIVEGAIEPDLVAALEEDLKAIAGAHELSLGDLIEGIVLHAFEGKAPFSHLLVERARRRGAGPRDRSE